MQQHKYIVFFVAILTVLGAVSVQAQEQTVLTLVVPQFWQNFVEDSNELVADFEAQWGIEVQVEFSNSGLGNGPTEASAVADYNEDLIGYLESGDVVYADESWLTPEVTRAGFVLDLMPLINADMNLNPNDFYPAVWQSFQWDGGMWALPTSTEPLFVDYVPQAFDEAGIAYPNANWTIDDFDFAVRELTQYNEENEVELPGAQVSNQDRAALFYAFMGRGFYNSDSFPDTPLIAQLDLAYIVEVWNELLADGVLITGGGGPGGGNNDIPIRLGSGGVVSFSIDPSAEDEETTAAPGGFNFTDESPERRLTTLPNGFVILQTNGFAISTGTQNQQMAYELTRFLSEQLAIANADVGGQPARISYFTEESGDTFLNISIERTAEDQALIEDALYNGVPTSELRFSRYVTGVLNLVFAGLDAVSAIQEAEINALETVEEMVNLEVNLTVDTPLALSVSENELILTFEIAGFGDGLPNQAEWDALGAEFAAQDPEVGAVNIEQLGPRQLLFGSFECAYYPSTLFVSINPETMLALDPLLFSDMNYNVNELPAGVLDLMQLNGFTYGIPMTVQPLMLHYNADMFQQAGVPEPIGGWTISEFVNALELLQFVVEEGDASFTPGGNTTAAVLMLILAQGANPIDFTTDPPTLDFTSPESVAAAETVLGWAKDGYMEYGGAGGFGGGPGGGGFNQDTLIPIGASFFAGLGVPDENELTTYPVGAQTPVALDVGAGYISNDLANPEACYRWMSYVANRPYVFTGSMPALVPRLYDPVVMEALSEEAIAAYQQIADMLNDPSVLSVNTGDPFIVTWLSDAFDAYVLEDADLLTELERAEQNTRDYMACTAELDRAENLFALFNLQSCVDAVNSAESQ